MGILHLLSRLLIISLLLTLAHASLAQDVDNSSIQDASALQLPPTKINKGQVLMHQVEWLDYD